MPIPTLAGITARTVTTARLTSRVLFCGDENAEAVLFLHGNASSATFWEETMLALPDGFRGIAPDQRGYGDADPAKKIDATRGLGDLADDALALLDRLGTERAHVVGHSLGGGVVWRLMMDAPERFLTVTFVAPASPYGFGGTKNVQGEPTWPDFAGSGAGIVIPSFARGIAGGDRSNTAGSPRYVMNNAFWKPPFRPAREEALLSAVLSQHIGEQDYPGDHVPSEHWPYAAPGVWGPANALSPKYAGDVTRLSRIEPMPPVLLVRGSEDRIFSDESRSDFAVLGALGVIPGYPGPEVFPAQPMVSQVQDVLRTYRACGGEAQEVVIEGAGHTPYLEAPDVFNAHFHAHLRKAQV